VLADMKLGGGARNILFLGYSDEVTEMAEFHWDNHN
jgi:hypothetical protein